jgi:hypothetical protein
MSYSLQPVRVATGFDEEGMLVLDEEQRLVAVLVRLSDDNEVAPGPNGTLRQALAVWVEEPTRPSPIWTWPRAGSANAWLRGAKRPRIRMRSTGLAVAQTTFREFRAGRVDTGCGSLITLNCLPVRPAFRLLSVPRPGRHSASRACGSRSLKPLRSSASSRQASQSSDCLRRPSKGSQPFISRVPDRQRIGFRLPT